MSCKPPLVPKSTYTILGFTVLIYLLQMASMAILNGDDLPLMLGDALFAWFAGPRWEVVGIYPVFICRINVNSMRSFWVQVRRS